MRTYTAKTGIDKLDLDHINIMYLIDAVLTESSSSAVVRISNQLVNAIVAHIANEESLFESRCQPFPLDHQQDHARFSRSFKQLQAQLKNRKIDVYTYAQEIKLFFTLHILEFDMTLMKQIRKSSDWKGLRLS